MPIFTFLDADRQETRLELDALRPRIATLAATLRAQVAPGATVGLMFRSEPILVLGWLACLHAGLRPLVMQYPTGKQSRDYWTASVSNTVERASLAAVLCDAHCNALGMGKLTKSIVLPDFAAITADPAAGTVAALLPEAFAIVQLSSGTTGFRKAVEFTSTDLRRHALDFNRTLQLQPGRDRVVSWLPLYHDMGYVACFVMPLVLGIDVVMMDPMVWVRDPALLFDAIERHAGTIAYMPNFGFELMTRAAPRKLPTMRYWVSCSEPVSALTSRRFIDHVGAAPESFAACYAMAENIFAVAMSRGLATRQVDGRDVVSCGQPIPGVELKVVADEIWVRSPTSLRNYIGGEDIRDAEGYYPTGDLGALLEGELYVTGRKQDLIIQAGRKFMLSDIDLAVNEAFPDVKGRVATVQGYDDRLGTQKPLILIESADFITRRDHEAVAEAVRNATGLDQIEVNFVPPRFLTKTSSGKINRKKSAEDWAAHVGQKAGAAVSQASVESELRASFAHLPWDKPVQEFMDSLSLTVLKIILNDAGVRYEAGLSLRDYAEAKSNRPSGKKPQAAREYIYIVNLADKTTLRCLSPRHLAELSVLLGAPVVVEHICLPPSPVLLSDLIFQDYFLPRVERENYAVVERLLNKLRSASLIVVDDVAEMMFPPAQVYGVLSHNLERDPRADLIAVRWQRYPQMHHKLPLTVVSGCDMPLGHRNDVFADLSAYLDVPIYRIGTLRDMVRYTGGWEYRPFLAKDTGDQPKVLPEAELLVKKLAQWVKKLPAPLRRQEGTAPSKMESSDLAHFCSRISNQKAIDAVLDSFDRFCVVGQESSVPYVAHRLEAMGKSFIRTMSYQPVAMKGLLDETDCILICGAKGKYTLTKPAVALMGADRTVDDWNPPDLDVEGDDFVEPVTRAPVSGQDWFYRQGMARGQDDRAFKALRAALLALRPGNRGRDADADDLDDGAPMAKAAR